MNYFFDITTVQKVFPILILNGAGLLVQVVMTLALLFIFELNLFIGALIILVLYVSLIILFARNGIFFALKRSDTKHNAIHYLQKVPSTELSKEDMLENLEEKMSEYVDARNNHFSVRVKQLSISFFFQGLIITGFFLLGGYLVINGKMPIGEFVAAEIIVVTLIYAINNFIKQLDYIYDGVEGFYKIGKLSESLEAKEKGDEING
jgi:ABC-type bacteriocin/lantibiotic exporter with double-glycine peptidase domain